MVFLVGGGCCLNCVVMCSAGPIMLEILKKIRSNVKNLDNLKTCCNDSKI